MFLTQQNYIEKILLKCGMYSFIQVQTPLAGHFRMSATQYPKAKVEQQRANIPY